jgi:hypothetical protein
MRSTRKTPKRVTRSREKKKKNEKKKGNKYEKKDKKEKEKEKKEKEKEKKEKEKEKKKEEEEEEENKKKKEAMEFVKGERIHPNALNSSAAADSELAVSGQQAAGESASRAKQRTERGALTGSRRSEATLSVRAHCVAAAGFDTVRLRA